MRSNSLALGSGTGRGALGAIQPFNVGRLTPISAAISRRLRPVLSNFFMMSCAFIAGAYSHDANIFQEKLAKSVDKFA